MITAVAAGTLGGLLALGVWEKALRARAYATVRVRVHVNGTRGKSTVTRLIAAGLRASGCRTLAKTTGTAARLILPDGTERPVVRRAPASIREQLWVLREARRHSASALVAECMAIDPALQDVAERQMIAATLGVITNARPDHGDVMGTNPAAVAAALAQTVPVGGTLVLGPDLDPALVAQVVRHRGARLVCADVATVAHLAPSGMPRWARDNLATALTATRVLGIDETVAYPAMLAADEDPGAIATWTVPTARWPVSLIDASAANDPESLALLLAGRPTAGRLYVFNHRADRPLRLTQFAADPSWLHGNAVIVSGDRPAWTTQRAVDRTRGGVPVSFVPAATLVAEVRRRIEAAPGPTTVILCGNTRGLDAAALATALGADRDQPASGIRGGVRD